MKFMRFAGAAVAALVVASAGQAAAAVITDGTGQFSVGIGVNGELYDVGSGIGFLRTGDGYDAIAPGTARDSWGLNAAFADDQFVGSNDIVSTDIVANGDSAVATTLTAEGFEVVQNYSFLGNILKIDTRVTNTTGDVLSAVFQRNVDWDMPTGGENVFGPFGPANGVVDSSYFGFESPDAVTPYGSSCKFGCNEVGDLGAGIKISLGTLNAGGSRAFTYYYGLSRPGTGSGDLIADAQAAGAEYLIATASEGAASHFAVLGVSGAVPEPAGWAMMIAGFFGLGFALRRPRPATA